MPMSEQPREGEKIMLQSILANPKRAILDIGAGAGKWGRLLCGNVAKIDGVEIWKPYINKYKLREVYDVVYAMDIREFDRFGNYHIIILGDVLEHLPYEDATVLVFKLKELLGQKGSKLEAVFLTIPITPCEQDGSVYGNPYETHRYQWTHRELVALGFKRLHQGWNRAGSVLVGTYIMERGKKR